MGKGWLEYEEIKDDRRYQKADQYYITDKDVDMMRSGEYVRKGWIKIFFDHENHEIKIDADKSDLSVNRIMILHIRKAIVTPMSGLDKMMIDPVIIFNQEGKKI